MMSQWLLIMMTIVMPLLLVGTDMVSDGGVLGQMWPYTWLAKYLAGAYSGNSTGGANISEAAANEERNMTVNDTGITNSTASEQEDTSEAVEVVILLLLFLVSIFILFVTTWNLLRSNPLATLHTCPETDKMV